MSQQSKNLHEPFAAQNVQQSLETDGNIVYGSMSSEAWRKQIGAQQIFAAKALDQVQQQDDEDAEFMLLEQVSKSNTVSFGVKPTDFENDLSPILI